MQELLGPPCPCSLLPDAWEAAGGMCTCAYACPHPAMLLDTSRRMPLCGIQPVVPRGMQMRRHHLREQEIHARAAAPTVAQPGISTTSVQQQQQQRRMVQKKKAAVEEISLLSDDDEEPQPQEVRGPLGPKHPCLRACRASACCLVTDAVTRSYNAHVRDIGLPHLQKQCHAFHTSLRAVSGRSGQMGPVAGGASVGSCHGRCTCGTQASQQAHLEAGRRRGRRALWQAGALGGKSSGGPPVCQKFACGQRTIATFAAAAGCCKVR